MNPNPDPTPLPPLPPVQIPAVQTPGVSLYEQTKITRDGLTIFKRYPGPNAEYYVRMAVQGRRFTRKLVRTADDSFKLARKIRDAAQLGRFDALDETKARSKVPAFASMQQIFDRYQENAQSVRGLQLRTVKNNISSFKLILKSVGPCCAAATDFSKMSSSVLTPALLESVKKRALERAAGDNILLRTLSITANSTIRQARSLFSKRLGYEFYKDLKLPDLTHFLAVPLLPVEKKKFRMPAGDLMQKIRANANLLKAVDPESYKIYLLSMGAGLRKGEIAHARLRWLEVGRRCPDATEIRVQTETDFHVKNNEERCIPLEPFIVTELSGLLVNMNPSDYILTGNLTERTDNVFRRFGAWLKTMGWDRRKKCHEMRKVYGSLVTEQAGVRTAQSNLGHASLSTTESHYVDPALTIAPVRIFQQKTA